jgi:putative transposase
MKNRVLMESCYLPGDLERQIGAFVDYHSNKRYHESIGNVTPADVYFARDKAIIREREKTKKLIIQQRRLQHQKQAPKSSTQTNQSLQGSNRSDVPFHMTTDTGARRAGFLPDPRFPLAMCQCRGTGNNPAAGICRPGRKARRPSGSANPAGQEPRAGPVAGRQAPATSTGQSS